MRGPTIPPEQLELELTPLAGPWSWPEVYGNANPVELEIGVGKGRFLRELAARHPERNYLAIERARKYARIALLRAARDSLANFRIFMGDGPELLQWHAPDQSLAAIHVFYPDPWPKKRHHKRRLINPDNLRLFARKLTADALLTVKTDFATYFAEIDQVVRANQSFELLESGPVDPARFEPALRTNYEVKTVGWGEKVYFLRARKR